MENIYIVYGYSDYSSKDIAAFAYKTKAENFCKMLNTNRNIRQYFGAKIYDKFNIKEIKFYDIV
jgi:hypothetical protein